MFMNLENVRKEWEYQVGLVAEFEKELPCLPNGSLSMKKIGGKEYMYLKVCDRNGTVWRSMANKDPEMVRLVNRKKVIEKSLGILKKNTVLLEKFLKKYQAYDPDSVLVDMPTAYLLATKQGDFVHYGQEKDGLASWSSLEEQEEDFYFDSLKHVTSKGLHVRSKSEAIIAELLDANELAYKYETKLKIGNKTFSPDFAVFRKEDQRIVYWEHFGLMSNEEYLKKMFYKLNEYQKAGIILWDNLVITCDSEDGNLDARQIIRIIWKMLI